eukprot:31017-Pelagococcus_subviridis.AAC.21
MLAFTTANVSLDLHGHLHGRLALRAFVHLPRAPRAPRLRRRRGFPAAAAAAAVGREVNHRRRRRRGVSPSRDAPAAGFRVRGDESRGERVRELLRALRALRLGVPLDVLLVEVPHESRRSRRLLELLQRAAFVRAYGLVRNTEQGAERGPRRPLRGFLRLFHRLLHLLRGRFEPPLAAVAVMIRRGRRRRRETEPVPEHERLAREQRRERFLEISAEQVRLHVRLRSLVRG